MYKTFDTEITNFEYPFSYNSFDEQLVLKGAEKDIFEIMAFLFTRRGCLPDVIGNKWYIYDKLHLLNNPKVIDDEILKLRNILSKLKPGFVTGVDYIRDDSDLVISINTTAGSIDVSGNLAKMNNISDGVSFNPKVTYKK